MTSPHDNLTPAGRLFVDLVKALAAVPFKTAYNIAGSSVEPRVQFREHGTAQEIVDAAELITDAAVDRTVRRRNDWTTSQETITQADINSSMRSGAMNTVEASIALTAAQKTTMIGLLRHVLMYGIDPISQTRIRDMLDEIGQ